MSNSLGPHGLQHTRLPCPSLSPGVCSNSCPLLSVSTCNSWCCPTDFSSRHFTHKKDYLDSIVLSYLLPVLSRALKLLGVRRTKFNSDSGTFYKLFGLLTDHWKRTFLKQKLSVLLLHSRLCVRSRGDGMISKSVPLVSETSTSYLGHCSPAGVLGTVGLLSFIPILLVVSLEN